MLRLLGWAVRWVLVFAVMATLLVWIDREDQLYLARCDASIVRCESTIVPALQARFDTQVQWITHEFWPGLRARVAFLGSWINS